MGAPPSVRRPLFGHEPTAAPLRLGRFDLIERIGAGGMAEVFRAAVRGPQGFERELVLKRILPQLSARERFTQMFVNEAKISALLAHPNIVQIFEFGEADGAYFIAMESVRGLTLREVLIKLRSQDRIMPLAAAAEIIREVLIALDYAHNLRGSDGRALEIVHRDISPSNVMLADTGAVKVLDFGIARAADIVADDEGKVVKGKIAYLAPEQISCGAIDARVDVFATGCVMFELLAGRVMFRAQNDLQKKVDLLAQTTAPPSAWNAEVPAALDRIVARATAREVEARYASAADMLADVENYLAAFRSSSRSVLRLVRSLAGSPVDDTGAGGFANVGPAALPESSAGTSRGRTARPAAPDPAAQVTVAAPSGHGGSTAEVAASPPQGARPGAATRTADPTPAQARSPGQPPRDYQAPRPQPERSEDPHTSTVGRGELAGPATHSSLRGFGSAEHNRFARNAWQRRVGTAAIGLLALTMLGGIVAGARSLVGRVSSHRAASAVISTPGKAFVLMTFISVPPGARIIDGGGRVLGQTPITLPIPVENTATQYRFEKDGFRAATAAEIANGDKTIEVELRPVRKAEKATRKAPAAKHSSRSR